MTNRHEPEQGSPTTALLTLNCSLAHYYFSFAKTRICLIFFSLCIVLTWGCLSIASSLHAVGNRITNAQTQSCRYNKNNKYSYNKIPFIRPEQFGVIRTQRLLFF